MNDSFWYGVFVGAILMSVFLLTLIIRSRADAPQYMCENTFKGDYSKTYDSKTGDAIYHCKGAK